MWQRIKAKAVWLFGHRTKVLGLAAVGIAFVQNNLGQLGHVLPDKAQGVILAVFGVLAFCVGLYNTFAAPQPPS